MPSAGFATAGWRDGLMGSHGHGTGSFLFTSTRQTAFANSIRVMDVVQIGDYT